MPNWYDLSRTELIGKCLEFEKSMDALIEKHNEAVAEQQRLLGLLMGRTMSMEASIFRIVLKKIEDLEREATTEDLVECEPDAWMRNELVQWLERSGSDG